MGLKDYVVPSTLVTLAPTTNTVTVRGLNFTDLSQLLNDHGPALVLIYSRVYAEVMAGKLDQQKVGDLIQTTLMETPRLIGDIIAIAAGEPDAADMALKLTPGVQLELMSAIIGHTLVSEAEVKKLVEAVTTMMEKVGDLATTLTSGVASQAGSGASAVA